jgi:hypothetical protein
MLSPSLYTGQGRVREHSDGDTDNNFSSDQSRNVGRVGTGSEADQKTESNGKEGATEHDEGFEAAHAHHDDTQNDTYGSAIATKISCR